MILVLAFAAWSLLLAVVGTLTGIETLTTIAASLGGLVVGSSLLVLVFAARAPEPKTVSRSMRTARVQTGRVQTGRSMLAAS